MNRVAKRVAHGQLILFGAILVVVLSFLLAGCGKSDNADSVASENAEDIADAREGADETSSSDSGDTNADKGTDALKDAADDAKQDAQKIAEDMDNLQRTDISSELFFSNVGSEDGTIYGTVGLPASEIDAEGVCHWYLYTNDGALIADNSSKAVSDSRNINCPSPEFSVDELSNAGLSGATNAYLRLSYTSEKSTAVVNSSVFEVSR
jgi:hypothetical protein